MTNRIVHVTEIPYTIRETYQRTIVLQDMTPDTIHGIVEQLTLTVYPVTLNLVRTSSSRQHKGITNQILQYISIKDYPYTTIKYIYLTITPVKRLTASITQNITIVIQTRILAIL